MPKLQNKYFKSNMDWFQFVYIEPTLMALVLYAQTLVFMNNKYFFPLDNQKEILYLLLS